MQLTRRAVAGGQPAAAPEAAAPPAAPPPHGPPPFPTLSVGETDAHDAPLPAPWAHAALLVAWLLPAALPVPAALAVVATPPLTILAAARRSVKPTAPSDSMTQRDALRFPLVGSALLLGLFLCFKFLPKALVNKVLTLYFVGLGVAAVAATAAPFAATLLPRHLARRTLSLGTLALPAWLSEPLDCTASVAELAGALPGLALCAAYALSKPWLANNALGLCFSLQGVELISLGGARTGALLLAGLFVYDVFWVFCTPVMVSVAKNFDAPIKLLFPRHGGTGPGERPFNMLGLGDIVIPGIFVALVLRMDVQRRAAHAAHAAAAAPAAAAPPPPPSYFGSVLLGYVAGLGTTIVVMNFFDAAQPALLYIVPALFVALFGRAAALGDLPAVWAWSEAAEEEGEGEGVGGARGEPGTGAAAAAAAAAAVAGVGAEPAAGAEKGRSGDASDGSLEGWVRLDKKE